MNIFSHLFHRLFGGPDKKPEPKNEPPKLDTSHARELLERISNDFPRPVSVTMKATQTTRPDPMAAAVSRAKADAKKTAVKGSVSSTSSSQIRAYDPLMDPLNPVSPLYMAADEPTRHRVHHVDCTSISDSVRHSMPSHSSPASSDYGSSHSHSSHDSGSHDSGSCQHSSGSDW